VPKPAPEEERVALVKYVDIASTIMKFLLSGNKSEYFMAKKQQDCQTFEIIQRK